MRHAHSLLALQAAAAMALLPWGKRPCQDYLKALREQTPARLDGDLVECHPLRHLRWTAGVAEEEGSSPLPPQLDFDARNSACHAAENFEREIQYLSNHGLDYILSDATADPFAHDSALFALFSLPPSTIVIRRARLSAHKGCRLAYFDGQSTVPTGRLFR